MLLKFFIASTPFGISPSSMLSDKSRDLSPLKVQTPGGTEPENWFKDKSTEPRAEQDPKVEGMLPENLFLAKETVLRDPHCRKKSSGNSPERLLLLKSSTRRLSTRAM